MTHDELKEILEHTAQDGMADEPILKALRAVVELHKPDQITPDGTKFYPQVNYLKHCINCNKEYPCPTIQAIEKELA